MNNTTTTTVFPKVSVTRDSTFKGRSYRHEMRVVGTSVIESVRFDLPPTDDATDDATDIIEEAARLLELRYSLAANTWSRTKNGSFVAEGVAWA